MVEGHMQDLLRQNKCQRIFFFLIYHSFLILPSLTYIKSKVGFFLLLQSFVLKAAKCLLPFTLCEK